MFSREVSTACELCPCHEVLPERGSNHPAFVEMLFLWGQTSEQDPRYRHVMLPNGFVVVEVDSCRFEVRDSNGFIRAVAFTPSARPRIPTITPVRRFSLSAEVVDSAKYRGVALDRESPVYRTAAFSTQREAVAAAKRWLDEHKPYWESYTSAVNFEPHS